MTVLISPGIAAELAAAGTENNPMILWDNLSADATWTLGGGSEIEPASNLQTPTTYDRAVFTLSGTGATSLFALQTVPRTFDIVCLAALTLGDCDVRVRIQTSIDGGSSYQTVSAGNITPTDNQAICFVFDGAPTTDDWRIRFDQGIADCEISLGVAFFGNRLTVPQRIYQGYTPPITPTRVELQSNVSAGANLLEASIIRKGSNMVANLTHLLPAFIRDTDANGWAAFQNHFNNGGAEFWLWRPTTFGDAFYGWRDGEPIIPTNSGPKSYMAASVEMRLFDDP